MKPATEGAVRRTPGATRLLTRVLVPSGHRLGPDGDPLKSNLERRCDENSRFRSLLRAEYEEKPLSVGFAP
jgi:hypothetical protein